MKGGMMGGGMMGGGMMGGGKDKGFGKGKDKGFGKGKGKSKEGGKGHLLPRTRISEAPFSGTITAFKGKYGWIEPAESIEHPKANLHKGGLFFSSSDLALGEPLEPGTIVEYHIWEDDTGLGAEEVTPVMSNT